MNGYSKMKIIGTATKSRSMDFSSDLLSSPPSVPQNPKSISSATTTPNSVTKFQEITNHQIIIRNPNKRKSPQDSSFSDQQEEYSDDYHHHHPRECNGGERFGHVKLSRNSSVSSASAVVQSAVKRAFSMRRSASVSERYRRIHDQSVTLSSPIDDYYEDGFGMEGTRSVKKHSRGKILKACKRFLGL